MRKLVPASVLSIFMTIRSGRRSLLPSRSPALVRLSLTIALPLLAFLVNQWLRPVLDPAFEPSFIAATAMVCWFCGLRWSLPALALSSLLLVYFFLEPRYSFVIPDFRTWLKLFFFFGANVVTIGLISNLHRVHAELVTSDTLHRNLAELIPFGGWISDPSGNMQFLSDSFLVTFGTTMDECSGLGWTRFLVEDQRDLVLHEWAECVRSGYFWDYEYRMVAPDGSHKIVLSRGVPVRGPGGRIRSWVGIHLDITDREQAIEDRMRQARDIARFNAELDQLAWASAHDLQEPLRMIASYLQLLQRRYKGKLDDEAHEFIGYAVEGADRLRDLLSDLLHLQQIGKGTRAQTLQPLASLITEALERIGSPAAEADIRWENLPEIVCDAVEFTQLFQHLIGNALTYSKEGIRPSIQISADRTAGGWTISVADNGIGIEPEYLGNIFKLFHRLHPRSRYTGTGIGLAICRKVVEVRGGRIWAESSPGEGSVFRFTVPDQSA